MTASARSLGAVAEKSLPEITRASERRQGRRRGRRGRAAPARRDRTRPSASTPSRFLTAARQDLTQAIGALAAEDAARLNKTARSYPGESRPADAVRRRAPDDCRRPAQRWSAGLRKSHQKLAEKLAPMADDAGFTLTLGLQTRGGQEGSRRRSEDAGRAGRQRTGGAAGHPGFARRIQSHAGNPRRSGRPAVARVAAAGQGPLHRDGGPARQGRCRLQGRRYVETRR